MAVWKCPDCGRRFAKRNQWHSCAVRGVEAHFEGVDPAVREIFDRLLERLHTLGPLRVDAVKTSINLISRHHFGGVMVRRKHLRVGFLSSEPIQSSRIVRSQRLGPKRVGNSVELHSRAEIDDQLMAWLREAYELQS
ncbi:MAG: DUF5655 domain-containing protein [Anaerolineales bacterium]